MTSFFACLFAYAPGVVSGDVRFPPSGDTTDYTGIGESMKHLTSLFFVILTAFVFCAVLVACDTGAAPTVSYSVAFSQTELTMTVGDMSDLPAVSVCKTVDGVTTREDLSCVYSVSDEEILRLNSNGKLVALAAGTTTLVAKYENATAVLVVTVVGQTRDKVTIHYDSGCDVPSFSREVIGDTVVLPALDRKGYRFDGWDTGDGVKPAGTAIQAPTESKTFRAVFSKIQYTITYILNGGSNAAANPDSYTIDSETIVLQYPEKAYATFAGWYTDAEMTAGIAVIPKGSTGNLVLYAKFSDKPVAAFSGGAGATGSTPFIVSEEGTDIVLPSNGFAKVGYRFIGWSDGSKRYSPGESYLLSASTTFTAEWEIIRYSITYHLDGGTNDAANPGSYTVTDGVIRLAAAQKSGYRFAGWYTDPTFLYPINTVDTASPANIELYAKFELLYEVSFDGNGGEGKAPATVLRVKNETLVLPESPFTNREGYFAGWSDGRRVYRPGETYTVTGKTVLTARWTGNFADGTPLFDLSEGGYTIVYQDSTAAAEAAESLREYIQKVLGVTVSSVCETQYAGFDYTTSRVISVGDTSVFRSLEHFRLQGATVKAAEVLSEALAVTDSFAVLTDRYVVCLVGNNENGVLYAADQFVEDYLGVRFLTPEYTYIPSKTSAEITTGCSTYRPEFLYRQYLNTATFYPSSIADLRYARHLRFNGDYITASNAGASSGFTWYTDTARGIGTAHNTLQFVRPADYAAYLSTMFFSYNGNIIDVCYTDGITSDGTIDRSTPEIDTAAEAMYAALYELLANTDMDHFWLSVGQADTNEYCKCADCVAATSRYNKSGITIRFWNAIIHELENCDNAVVRDKDYRLVMFAYQYNLFAPVVNGTVDPSCIPDASHLWVRIAPIVMDRYLALNDSNQPLLQRENGRQYDRNATLGHLPSADLYEDWAAVTSNLFSWTYAPDFDHYFTYTGALANMKNNLLLMKACGVDYVFIQGIFDERINADQYLEAYVMSKLAWNLDADVTELRNEFLRCYYGEDAYENVRRYYDAFDTAYKTNFSASGTGLDGSGNVYGTLTDSFYLSQIQLLDAAAAEASEEIAERLSRLKLTPLFMLAKQNTSYRSQFTELFTVLGGVHISEGRTMTDYAW